MKIKKIIMVAVLALVLTVSTFMAVACNSENNGTVPEYLGMTISQSAASSPQIQASNFTIRAADTEKDSDGTYYTEVGKEIYVTVKLHNPDNFIILSFTLNGYHYQSYEFERGSTGESLILKCDAGNVAGLTDYTIDNIKYINIDGAYKDVKIVGNKKIKVNIRALVEQPLFSGELTFGDPLPAITTATTGGSIKLDAGQTLAVGTNNYNWTFSPDGTAGYDFANTTGTISLAVNKVKVPKPVPQNQEITYSGVEQSYLIADDPRYTVTGNNGTSVGNYSANVALKDTANYEWADGTTNDLAFSWSIAKANVTVQQPTFTGQLTFGDPLPAITTTTSGGTIALNAGQTLTAGMKNYDWTFTPYDSTNCNWSNTAGTISLTVGKADQSIPGGTIFKAVTASAVTEISVTVLGVGYEYSKDKTAWQASNLFTGLTAGTEYTFYARLKETDNYNHSEPVSTRLTTPVYEDIFTWLNGTVTGLTALGKLLYNITIPEYLGTNKIISIGNNAFMESNIAIITLPDSIVSIGKQAFYDCNNLVSITIPDGVTEISDYTFSNCDNLTSVILHDSINSIGEHAFQGSARLTNITTPNGLTKIGDYAFEGCIGLKNITLPEGITRIGTFTFHNTGLTSIKIPDSVTSIGEAAFHYCLNLANIEAGSGITNIGSRAFTSTAWFNNNNNWENGFLYLKTSKGAALYLIGASSALSGTITIKAGINVIGAQAFFDCSNIKSIILPNSIISICDYAFGACKSLANVFYAGTETEWGSVRILSGNDALDKASVYLYSETQPEVDYKYWRYMDGAPTIWMQTSTFEAEYVDLTGKIGVGFSGSAEGAGMIEKDPAASNGAYIGYTNSNKLSFAFIITSDQAAEGFIKLRLGSFFGTVEMSPESFGVIVNGQAISYNAFNIAPGGFLTFDIGSIDLKAGENLIVLDILKDYPIGTTVGPLIDCLIIQTNAALSWNPVLGNLT